MTGALALIGAFIVFVGIMLSPASDAGVVIAILGLTTVELGRIAQSHKQHDELLEALGIAPSAKKVETAAESREAVTT